MRTSSVFALAAVSACEFDPQRVGSDTSDEQVDAAPATVYRDCLDARERGVTTNGIVQIDLGGTPFEAYCDMTTAGGGWTLVWSYGFTDYAEFDDSSNAITPRPTWVLATISDQPTSTTVPRGPGLGGALEFARWIDVGESFLVDSNINHVISCTPGGGPGGGSLARLKMGTVDCSMVRAVAPLCPTNVPTTLGVVQGALGLLGPDTYYYWDTRTTEAGGNWPTHDPCGTNQQNHVRDVSAPYGAVFLRR